MHSVAQREDRPQFGDRPTRPQSLLNALERWHWRGWWWLGQRRSETAAIGKDGPPADDALSWVACDGGELPGKQEREDVEQQNPHDALEHRVRVHAEHGECKGGGDKGWRARRGSRNGRARPDGRVLRGRRRETVDSAAYDSRGAILRAGRVEGVYSMVAPSNETRIPEMTARLKLAPMATKAGGADATAIPADAAPVGAGAKVVLGAVATAVDRMAEERRERRWVRTVWRRRRPRGRWAQGRRPLWRG